MNGLNIVPYGSWYTLKRNGKEIVITGYDPSQTIDVGFFITIGESVPRTYQIIDIKRRNHRGEFKEEVNRINSFYSAQAYLIENESKTN